MSSLSSAAARGTASRTLSKDIAVPPATPSAGVRETASQAAVAGRDAAPAASTTAVDPTFVRPLALSSAPPTGLGERFCFRRRFGAGLHEELTLEEALLDELVDELRGLLVPNDLAAAAARRLFAVLSDVVTDVRGGPISTDVHHTHKPSTHTDAS